MAIRRLAIVSGHSSIISSAVVNPLTCVACGLCLAVCPYEAIALHETKVLGLTKRIARVDPNACMACGLCGALCRSASIGLPEGDDNQCVMEELRQWLGNLMDPDGIEN
jgi:ferredoxin